jgi:hypothetical protein
MSESPQKTALCLDIDGTLYRDGSVFIESISYLPFVQSGHWSPTDRRMLRRAVGLVGGYYGNIWTEKRWQMTLRVVDILQRTGNNKLALSLLDTLRELQARLNSVITSEYSLNSPSTGNYNEMRISLLNKYAKAITTHHRADVRTAVENAISRCTLIDDTTATALEDITTSLSSSELVLITDMPTLIAEMFASEAIAAPVETVVATKFETDQRNRFTGEFQSINKSKMIKVLNKRYNWDRVIAAGDTVRDLEMQSTADQFIAVSGQGRIDEHLQEPYVTASKSNANPIDGSDNVYVPRDVSLGMVLRRAIPP